MQYYVHATDTFLLFSSLLFVRCLFTCTMSGYFKIMSITSRVKIIPVPRFYNLLLDVQDNIQLKILKELLGLSGIALPFTLGTPSVAKCNELRKSLPCSCI